MFNYVVTAVVLLDDSYYYVRMEKKKHYSPGRGTVILVGIVVLGKLSCFSHLTV